MVTYTLVAGKMASRVSTMSNGLCLYNAIIKRYALFLTLDFLGIITLSLVAYS